jgi:hypothetical protein
VWCYITVFRMLIVLCCLLLLLSCLCQVRVTREGHNEYFSVLIKAAEDGQSIEEVYRVKVICYNILYYIYI